MLVPFFVDDNTGLVLVDPRGADLDLHHDFQEEFSDSFFTLQRPGARERQRAFSRAMAFTRKQNQGRRILHQAEEALFILGTLAENPGLEVGPQPIHDVEAYQFIRFSRILIVD